MYLDETIKRINNVKWHLVGTKIIKQNDYCGYEFLRRLAKFFKDESIKPRSPAYTNIAQLLGDIEKEVVLSDYCNSQTVEFTNNRKYTSYILQHYIQLGRYVDKNPNAIKYLEVCDPLIRVYERGGMLVLKHLSLDIEKLAYYPLNGWYEDFIDAEPEKSTDNK